MSLVVFYFLHNTSVLSFYIDVVLTLSISCYWIINVFRNQNKYFVNINELTNTWTWSWRTISAKLLSDIERGNGYYQWSESGHGWDHRPYSRQVTEQLPLPVAETVFTHILNKETDNWPKPPWVIQVTALQNTMTIGSSMYTSESATSHEHLQQSSKSENECDTVYTEIINGK